MRFSHCADLGVTQRFTDSYVALYGHAGQVDWGVSGGEDCHQDEEAAERDVDLVEDVAQNKQRDGDRQLDGVIYHHVDEKDVARVFVKGLGDDKGRDEVGKRTDMVRSVSEERIRESDGGWCLGKKNSDQQH